MAQIPTTYDDIIWLMCRRYWRGVDIEGQGFDMRWIKAQIMAESGYKTHAVSSAGARGLMQLMPATSAEIASKLRLPDTPFDPYTNIVMGTYYLRQMWDIWKKEQDVDRLRFAFGSYNAGPGTIVRAQMRVDERGYSPNKWASITRVLASISGQSNARQTTEYVDRIERYYTELKTIEGRLGR